MMPYMLSQVNHHLKQSGVAMEKDACTAECELFKGWHTLAHMEDKLSHRANSTIKRDHIEVQEDEDDHLSHPGLLSVDAIGHAILSTNLSDFQSDLKAGIQ